MASVGEGKTLCTGFPVRVGARGDAGAHTHTRCIYTHKVGARGLVRGSRHAEGIARSDRGGDARRAR